MQGERLSCRSLNFPRGSVLGPLVVAGISIRESRIGELSRLGVRDSKSLSPSRRTALNKRLRGIGAKIALAKVQPSEIDKAVLKGERYRKLNFLEAKAMAKVITKLRPNIAYVDASDVSCERFETQIQEELGFRLPIVSEHKADITYPIVSAASILAKVERDRCMRSICRRWGDAGTGYPSDHRTVTFLNEMVRSGDKLPGFVRKSWKTCRRILASQEVEV